MQQIQFAVKAFIVLKETFTKPHVQWIDGQTSAAYAEPCHCTKNEVFH